MSTETGRSRFRSLVEDAAPLVIPGAHDALSARMVESAGFAATYVGSYGTSAAAFGLPDVGALTLTELAEQAARVSAAVSIPVLADAEAGFFAPANMWRTTQAFERAGVCGIHIEDHAGGKHTDVGRSLQPLDGVVQRIRAALAARVDPDFQVIGRTDALWVSDDVDEAVGRMRAYAEAGADIVFPTGITPRQLARIRERIPGRVLVLGDLPRTSVAEMSDAGADVILYYGFTLTAAARGMGRALAAMRQTSDIRLLDDMLEDNASFEARLDYAEYAERTLLYSTEK